MKHLTFAILIISIVLPLALFSLYPQPEIKNRPAGFYPGDPLPEKTAYLTFDDGPSDWTERVLDILDDREVKATFFICANWLPGSTIEKNAFEKYRGTLLRMIHDGHSIGNHTRSHQNFSTISAKEMASQLDKNQELLDRALGERSVKMTLMRPPFGEPWFTGKSPAALKSATDIVGKRALVILWSKHFFSGDSMDWVRGDWYQEGPRVDIDHREFKNRMLSIYDRLIKRVDGGGMIFLFHDTHRTSTETLPLIIDELKNQGYTFGTIEDYVRWRWKKSSQEMIRQTEKSL